MDGKSRRRGEAESIRADWRQRAVVAGCGIAIVIGGAMAIGLALRRGTPAADDAISAGASAAAQGWTVSPLVAPEPTPSGERLTSSCALALNQPRPQ